jgi:diguanylate cyclase (GGDEF)-like protein
MPRFSRSSLGLDETTRGRAALLVLQGAEADLGKHIWLDRDVTLGRDPLVELPLADEVISRRHCKVKFGDGGFLVEDLGSTNGTALNGEKIVAPRRLRSGDQVRLGGVVVKFVLADPIEHTFHAQMDERVGTDELTGLVAKRRFDAALDRALEAARTMKTPLSVMMLDMDGLKRINDAHGHPVGGATIAAVGKIIGEVVTPHGAACRLGGDEFVAFLRGLTKPLAVQFGESIRSWVATHKFEKDGVVVQPTLSIGIAAFPSDGKTPEKLLRRADEALYRAKKEGRDRVRT